MKAVLKTKTNPHKKSDLQDFIGCIPNTGNSVKEVRAIRRMLSKQDPNLEELNNL